MISETALRVTRDHKLADDWALVLITQGLSPSIRLTQDGLVLSVPDDEVERALAGLSAYEKENPSREQEQESTPAKSPNFAPGLIVAVALVSSHFITVGFSHIAPWFERGAADAERILAGELWRTATALTLHADLGHLLSNAVAAAIFLTILSSMVGAGLSVFLLIMAGAGGNLANASLQGSGHLAIGASTAIFGIIGAVGGAGVVRRQQGSGTRAAWIPIAAAIALLAMLGTGSGRVDVLAHFFGFLFGAVAGVIVAFILPHRASPKIQWLWGTAGIVVLVYCWIRALS
jgi:rhomboid protease GluP